MASRRVASAASIDQTMPGKFCMLPGFAPNTSSKLAYSLRWVCGTRMEREGTPASAASSTAPLWKWTQRSEMATSSMDV